MPDQPQPRDPEITFGVFVRDRYWPVVSPPLAPQSLSRERSIIARAVSVWDTRPLASIAIEDCERWYNVLRAEMRPATVNKHRYRLRHLFATARRWGLIDHDPMIYIRKLREPRGRVRWLTDGQRDALIANAASALRAYIIAGRTTAARLRNLTELRWRDVDLANGMVLFPTTKNGDPQMVPIIPTLRTLLDELGANGMPPEDRVLPFMYPTSVSRAFRKLCKRLGIKNFRFHDLRHDVASRLAMTGANQRLIMEVLGHRDPKMSMRYTHVAAEVIRGALERAL
jgi:integrase